MMRICYETAKEMAEALLIAVELAEKYDEEVVLTVTKTNKWIALIGDEDCGTRFKIDPPAEKHEIPKLSIAV